MQTGECMNTLSIIPQVANVLNAITHHEVWNTSQMPRLAMWSIEYSKNTNFEQEGDVSSNSHSNLKILEIYLFYSISQDIKNKYLNMSQ